MPIRMKCDFDEKSCGSCRWFQGTEKVYSVEEDMVIFDGICQEGKCTNPNGEFSGRTDIGLVEKRDMPCYQKYQ